MSLINRLFLEENGQGMVEYALIIGLVGVLLIGALTAMKNGLISSFANSADQIPK